MYFMYDLTIQEFICYAIPQWMHTNINDLKIVFSYQYNNRISHG